MSTKKIIRDHRWHHWGDALQLAQDTRLPLLERMQMINESDPVQRHSLAVEKYFTSQYYRDPKQFREWIDRLESWYQDFFRLAYQVDDPILSTFLELGLKKLTLANEFNEGHSLE
jgi:hypothetical protein